MESWLVLDLSNWPVTRSTSPTKIAKHVRWLVHLIRQNNTQNRGRTVVAPAPTVKVKTMGRRMTMMRMRRVVKAVAPKQHQMKSRRVTRLRKRMAGSMTRLKRSASRLTRVDRVPLAHSICLRLPMKDSSRTMHKTKSSSFTSRPPSSTTIGRRTSHSKRESAT